MLSIFSMTMKGGLDAAVGVAASLYALKQKIAGKKAVEKTEESKADGTVTLNAGGDIIIIDKQVFNLYKDHPETTDAIDSSFSALEENPAITGVEMNVSGKTIFKAKREEFSGIATSPNFENENIRHNTEMVRLTVVKPYLAPSKTRKWEFIYNGVKITAPILDEAFLDSLDHVPFMMGTKMLVELDVLQEYDELYKTYLNKKFTVLRVVKVDNLPKTEPMF